MMRGSGWKNWKRLTPGLALALGILFLSLGQQASHQAPVILAESQMSVSLSETSVFEEESVQRVILQGQDVETVASAVLEVGGNVTHKLGIIKSVGAELTASQIFRLQKDCRILRFYEDSAVETASETDAPSPWAATPTLVGARDLHDEGIYGDSVTVAVIDTGFKIVPAMNRDIYGVDRSLVRYNAINDEIGKSLDKSGHGNHVTSIILTSNSSEEAPYGYNGIAPNARVVPIKAFDKNGQGTYANVIRGLDFILANKDKCNIRVLNCSFSSPVRSLYWDDPLNQAIMAVWKAGIVVVASAGNRGPDPMTIGSPGNVPYIITVGAMTDNYTPADPSDDRLAKFSSTGPTAEGFVKPEVLAPGGHLSALMRSASIIASTYPEFHDGGDYFIMSGTSQAAAVVTGIVTLMLDQKPYLTPDEVKYQLMATANPAMDESGVPMCSVFQQGAGLVNAYDAVHTADVGFANQGLNVDLEL